MNVPAVNPEKPILEVSPANVQIKFVPNKDINVELTLKNLLDKPVLFKVKTTAPDRYQVRPIISTVPPGGVEKCVLSHRALPAFPARPEETRHKFRVQSIQLDEEVSDPQEHWRMVEKEHKKHGYPTYHDYRISCELVNTTEDAPPSEGCANCVRVGKERDQLFNHTVSLSNSIKDLSHQIKSSNEENDELRQSVVQLESELAKLSAASAQKSEIPGVVAVTDDKGLTLPLLHIIIIAIIAFLLGAFLF